MSLAATAKLSPYAEVVPPVEPPPAGTLQVTDTAYGNALAWNVDVPAEYAAWVLEWSPDGTNWIELARLADPEETTYTDYAVPIGQSRFYRLGIALVTGSVGSYTPSVEGEVTGTGQTMFTDTFGGAAGTLLTAWTNGGNSTWKKTGGGGEFTISSAGRVYATAGCTVVNVEAAPVADNYRVSGTIFRLTQVGSAFAGLIVKGDDQVDTGIHGGFTEDSDMWQIVRRIAGGSSVLAETSAALDLPIGGSIPIMLEVQGSTINLYVNGVLRLSAQDTTLGRGYPGLRGNAASTNTTGLHIDGVSATVPGPSADQAPPAAPSIALAAGTGGVNVTVTHAGGDAAGVALYRSLRASGPYTFRGLFGIDDSPQTIFDAITTFGPRYYYRAGLVDTSGNHSLLSGEQSILTNATMSTGVARFGDTVLDLWPTHESVGIVVPVSGDANHSLRGGQTVTSVGTTNTGNLVSMSVLALQVPIPARSSLVFRDNANNRWVRVRTMTDVGVGGTALVLETVSQQIGSAATAAFSGIQTRKQGPGNPNADWENGWRLSNAYDWKELNPERLMIGNAMFLDEATSYDVRVTFYSPDGIEATPGTLTNWHVATGTISTNPAPIHPDDAWTAAVAAGTARWVDPEVGNNANNGLTAGAAWATLDHALQQNQPLVVKLRAGDAKVHQLSTRLRSTPIHLIGETPAVDDSAVWPNVPQPINPGNRAVIESPYFVAAGTGAWVSEPLAGPAGTGTYNVWKCAAINATTAPGMNIMFYAPDRHPDTMDDDGRLIVNPTWVQTADSIGPITGGYFLGSPAGWAEVVQVGNTTMDYGVHFGADGVYARLPGNVNPNTMHCWFSAFNTSGRLRFNGPNMRISNIEFRGVGVQLMQNCVNMTIDRCIFNGGQITFQSSMSNGRIVQPSHVLAEKFYAVRAGLWDETATRGIGMPWGFPKASTFITSMLPLPDNTTDKFPTAGKINESNGHFSWGNGAKGVTYRDGTIDGYFNGVVTRNDRTDHGRAEYDVTRVKFRRIMDDGVEPEQAAINIRVWDCDFEDCSVCFSFVPANYGQLIYVFNRMWRIGMHGMMESAGGVRGSVGGETSSFFFKMDSGNPNPDILLAFNTGWTNVNTSSATRPQIRTKAMSEQASGATNGVPNPREHLHIIGNIWRVTRDITDSVKTDSPNEYTEHDNIMVTSVVGVTRFRGNNTMAQYINEALPNVVGVRTNNLGFDFDGWSALDTNHLTNPSAGDLTLKAGSVLRNDGPLIVGIKETYLGTGPSRGYKEAT